MFATVSQFSRFVAIVHVHPLARWNQSAALAPRLCGSEDMGSRARRLRHALNLKKLAVWFAPSEPASFILLPSIHAPILLHHFYKSTLMSRNLSRCASTLGALLSHGAVSPNAL